MMPRDGETAIKSAKPRKSRVIKQCGIRCSTTPTVQSADSKKLTLARFAENGFLRAFFIVYLELSLTHFHHIPVRHFYQNTPEQILIHNLDRKPVQPMTPNGSRFVGFNFCEQSFSFVCHVFVYHLFYNLFFRTLPQLIWSVPPFWPCIWM